MRQREGIIEIEASGDKREEKKEVTIMRKGSESSEKSEETEESEEEHMVRKRKEYGVTLHCNKESVAPRDEDHHR